MLINVFDEDLNTGAFRLIARNVTVAEIMGDDHEETDRVHRDLFATGQAQYGGGAAPFCIIFRTAL